MNIKNIMVIGLVSLVGLVSVKAATVTPTIEIKGYTRWETWSDVADSVDDIMAINSWEHRNYYYPDYYPYTSKLTTYDTAWHTTYGFDAIEQRWDYAWGSMGNPNNFKESIHTNGSWVVTYSTNNPPACINYTDPPLCQIDTPGNPPGIAQHCDFTNTQYPGSYTRNVDTWYRWRITGDPTGYHTVYIYADAWGATWNGSECVVNETEIPPSNGVSGNFFWNGITESSVGMYYSTVLGDGTWREIFLRLRAGHQYEDHYHYRLSIEVND